MQTTTRELLLNALIATGFADMACDEPKQCGKPSWGGQKCGPCQAADAVKQAREEADEFLVIHSTPNGLNVFIVEAQSEPPEVELAGLCDYDNSRDESLDCHRLSHLERKAL